MNKVTRKLFANLTVFSLLLSLFLPYIGITNAADQGTLTIGMNIDKDKGSFEVKDATNETVMSSADCGLQENGGSYTCAKTLDNGFYTVNFVKGVDGYDDPTVNIDGVSTNDNPVNIQLTTAGKTVMGHYAVTTIQNQGTLTIGMNIDKDKGSFEVKDATNETVMSSADCGLQENGGSYTCAKTLDNGFYTVNFVKGVDGYDDPTVNIDGVSTNDNPVNIQLTTAGKTVMGHYAVTTIQNQGTLTIGMNIDKDKGSFEVKDATNETVMSSADCGLQENGGSYTCAKTLDNGFYTVNFVKGVDGYDDPTVNIDGVSTNDNPVNIQLTTAGKTVMGHYAVTNAGSGGTINIQIVNQNGDPITDGQWNIYQCTGNDMADCPYDPSVSYSSGQESKMLSNVPANNYYGIRFSNIHTEKYQSVMLLSANPALLEEGNTITFKIQYTEKDAVVAPVLKITKIGLPIKGASDVTYIEYTLTYENNGNGAATGVKIEDVFDAGELTEFNFYDVPGNGSCNLPVNENKITCSNLPDLAPGATGVIHYNAKIAEGLNEGDTINNIATIIADGDCDDASDSAQVTVVKKEDLPKLAINKTGVPINGISGETEISYTLTYKNDGNIEATGVEIKDVFSAGALTNFNFSNVPGSGSCNLIDNEITCSNLPDLAPDATGKIKYTATIAEGLANGTEINNIATITADGRYSATSNKVTIDVVKQEDLPDLTIGKTVKKAGETTGGNSVEVAPGDELIYTITYGNNGADGGGNATGVEIEDTFDDISSLENIDFGADSHRCAIANNVITCDIGDLNYGVTDTITYTTTVKSDATDSTITSEATIKALEADADNNNNATEKITTTVRGSEAQSINLNINKVVKLTGETTGGVTSIEAAPGDSVTYTLTYGNSGRLDATGVTIIDNYDQDNITITQMPQGCTNDNDILTCTIGDLNASVTGTPIEYTAQINNDTENNTVINNTATIGASASSGNDQNTNDNTSSATVTVKTGVETQRIDLNINKTVKLEGESTSGTSIEAAPGDSVTYTLTYGNSGRLDATGVTIIDNYDQDNITITQMPQGCTNDNDILTCTIGDLNAGVTDASPLEYTAQINDEITVNNTEINNTATIGASASSGNDPNTNDNTSSATITVIVPEQGDVSISKVVNNQNSVTVNNNALVNYTITVTRNRGDNGTMVVNVTDSFADPTNGGFVNYVPNTINCTGVTCDITGNPEDNPFPINVSLDGAGSEAVITYEARVNNSGIPTVQEGATPSTSSIVNTATATYGEDDTTTQNSATVTINGAVSTGPGPGPTGGGGGGGGGGGYMLMHGEMRLEIEKMVSTDGENYVNAAEESLAIVVPENKSTRLYAKVRVANKGVVSAKQVKFRHSFDTGDSDMTASGFENLKNAALNEDGDIIIDTIMVGKSHEFSYSVLVEENGINSNPAQDVLEVISYKSNLDKLQDRLKYVSIGNILPSYIFAGRIPTKIQKEAREGGGVETPDKRTTSTDFLKVTVGANRSDLVAGDEVNFTIKVKNISESDLTGLYISHNYDSNLEIQKTFGGRNNGQAIQWQRAILRPNQKASYQFRAKVKSGVMPGTIVRSATRILLNEYEYSTQVATNLTVVDGRSAIASGKVVRLAQTGPAGIIFYLTLIAIAGYFGRNFYRRYAYARLRTSALRPV